MKLSVVIPTYKRDKFLLATLEELLHQEYDDYEIVVVSQSRVEDSNLSDFLKKNKDKIKYFEQLDKTGAVFNRNLGIQKAKGDIVLFLDDDIKPLSKDFLKNHVKNYENREIGAVAGRIEQEDFPPPNERLKTGHITKTGKFITNFNSNKRQYVMGGISANLSIRRDLLHRINGFDENYQRGMREESDLCLRIGRFSKIVFDPTADVFHYAAKTGGMETRSKEKKEKRLHWYQFFFHNEILFFLKFLPLYNLPIFVLIHRLRPALACMFWYGKGSPKALITPIIGYIKGIQTYRGELRTKSKWL